MVLTFRVAVVAAATEEMAGMVRGGMVLVVAAATEEMVEVLTQLKMTAALVAAVDMERMVVTPRHLALAVAVGMAWVAAVATEKIKALAVAADMVLAEIALEMNMRREGVKVLSAVAVGAHKVLRTKESALAGLASALSSITSRRDNH